MSHPTDRGVLDTSALIDLADLEAYSLPAEPLITAITLAELSRRPARRPSIRVDRLSLRAWTCTP